MFKLINNNKLLFSLLLSYSLMIIVLEYALVTYQGDYVQIIIAICYAAICLYSKNHVALSVKQPITNSKKLNPTSELI